MKKNVKHAGRRFFTALRSPLYIHMLPGLTALVLSMLVTPGSAAVLVDMAGRNVTLPVNVRSVATVGPVPVLNSFVFAAGAGDRIANGLPGNFRKPMWKYQEVFVPGLKGRPVLQSAGGVPDLEAIIKAAPDVVLTMDLNSVASIERIGIPVLYLSWKNPDDIKKAVKIVARLFGRDEIGEAYAAYFDETLERVRRRMKGFPDSKRPKVLFCSSIRTMTQPHLIAEWWIEAAGGKSVTRDGRDVESLSYSLEKIILWNPDVILVPNVDEVEQVYADPKLRTVRAVAGKRVYAAPSVLHLWAHRTIEQPLTVLWAAKKFFPAEFADLDMESEMRGFYLKFFGYKMSRLEASEILKGLKQ